MLAQGGRVGCSLIQEEGEPSPSKEEETSSRRLSKRQQIQQLGCLRSVSRKFLGLLSSGAQVQTL